MSYIGKSPTIGNFQVCDSISVVNGQAAYTMQVNSVNVVPESANHMLVSLNGVLQKPGSSFTVSGSTITFASNLSTGDVIDFITILGNVLDLGVPSDDTVTAAKLNDDIISGQTELATTPADTDELLISDAGTLKRIDYSLIKSTPGLNLIKTTAITSGVAQVDFDNTYVNSTYNNYKMIIRGLSTSADNQDIYIKFSVDNGSSFITMVGARINVQINSGSQPQGGSGNLSGGFPLGSDEEGDDTKQTNAEMTFYDLNSDNSYKFGTGMATVVNQNGDLYSYTVSGYGSSTSAVNFIRVYTSAGGNLDDGSISLYGFSE